MGGAGGGGEPPASCFWGKELVQRREHEALAVTLARNIKQLKANENMMEEGP